MFVDKNNNFESEHKIENYILGYRKGWDEGGGSLSIGNKLSVIHYQYIKGKEFFYVAGAIIGGLYLFILWNKRHKAED
jgi:hypothetical protein